jgi:hypothetical protein
MMLFAVLHAGHEAVCYGTCWLLWYCIHLNMLVMMLCALVHGDSDDLRLVCAGHDTVLSCMCLSQYCILLYLLATILYALVCACHNTMYSCTC